MCTMLQCSLVHCYFLCLARTHRPCTVIPGTRLTTAPSPTRRWTEKGVALYKSAKPFPQEAIWRVVELHHHGRERYPPP